MTYVLGIGNKLLKDDGIGVRVAGELQKMNLPDSIKVVDAGTGILKMFSELTKARKIIILDAVRSGGTPGTIYRFDRIDELPVNLKKSIHDVQFQEVITYINLLGHEPNVVFFGMEPKEISFSLELSPEIEERIPILVKQVCNHLHISSN